MSTYQTFATDGITGLWRELLGRHRLRSSDSWLVTELFSLRLRNHVGETSRRWMRDSIKEHPDMWKELPKWFKEEARPYLDPKWKPKVTRPKFDAEGVMEAIESFAPKQ